MYEAELRFMLTALKKCHVPVHLLQEKELFDGRLDMGLRALMQLEESILTHCVREPFILQEQRVYTLCDRFGCRYLFFLLPRGQKRLLLVGPYVNRAPEKEEILEKSERAGIPAVLTVQIEKYFTSLPVVVEEYLFSMIDTFCEQIWQKKTEGCIVALESGDQEAPAVLLTREDVRGDWNMQLLEQRYDFENEMLLAVSRGQIHKARAMLNLFSNLSFEKRLSDPLRNLKNYCIIMNTLLRKAAEAGGVHPLFLDRMSSSFAGKIEQMDAVNAGNALMSEMFESYCRLVRQHHTRDYSPPVQKAVAMIESDLTQELTLHALAENLSISRSYLSSLFRKETGVTVTDYVNRRRVDYAALLLSTTQLQVQTVAQHCGMPDVQYFSKLFKKFKGETPHHFRKNNQKTEA